MLVTKLHSHAHTPLNQADRSVTFNQNLSLALIQKNLEPMCQHTLDSPQQDSGTKPEPRSVVHTQAQAALGWLGFVLGASPLEKGAGTWARGMPFPERRQAGVSGSLS